MAGIGPEGKSKKTIEERLDDLERRGVVTPPAGPREPVKPVARRKGALERSLADRDRFNKG